MKISSQKIIGIYVGISIMLIASLIGFDRGQKSLMPDQNQAGGEVAKTDKIPDYLTQDVDFKQFWQIWEYIRDNYVESDVPETQLFYGALSGLVASLHDPYSVFLNPEISEKFKEELSGSFEGIGAEIGIKNDRLTIIAPLPGTPADKSGLRPGDKVLAIDGENTAGIALDYAVSIIRGEKGTEVILTVLSNGDQEPRDVSIIRGKIEIDSVRFIRKEKIDSGSDDEDGGNVYDGDDYNNEFLLMDGEIAYLELLYFNENTLSDWNQTIQKILAKDPKGIILDLRNNPGGFLNTAIEIAGEWVNGQTVVFQQLRDGNRLEHHSERQARLEGIPTVVLVNRGSASGSEIVAGALQDYGVATVVGEITFGKGSVQDLKKFKDGSSVKLTVAEWLTPDGRNINKEGIKPDVEVEMTHEDYDQDRDPQLDKALEILKQ